MGRLRGKDFTAPGKYLILWYGRVGRRMFGLVRGPGVWGGVRLESFVVQNESFDDEFAEGFSGPNTETSGFYRIDAEADARRADATRTATAQDARRR